MKNVIISILVLIILIVTSACNRENSNEMVDVAHMDSQQIVKYYFDAWHEKNEKKMRTVLAERMQQIAFHLESVNSIKLDSVESASVTNLPETVKNLQQCDVYKAIYEIDIKGGYASGMQSGRSTKYFYVGKESDNSPWLIYEFGSGY